MPPSDLLCARAAAFFARHRIGGAGVAAVSGGCDSMVLLDVLARLGRVALVLHVHHGLRGADADADAALVAGTAAQLGLPVQIVRAEAAPASGVEAWARGVRRAAFADAARSVGATWVATAHHEDDQAETFLLALLRGAGTRGLAAMRPVGRLPAPGETMGGADVDTAGREAEDLDAVQLDAAAGDRPDGAPRSIRLVRPFLDVPRANLVAHATLHGLAWRHDASNDDARMRRNVLRHDVLPRLDTLVPGAARRIARAAACVDAERRLAAPARRRLRAAALASGDDGADSDAGGTLRLDALDGLPREIRRGLLLDALAAFLPGVPADARSAARLDALATAPVGRRLAHPAGTVWRGRGVLRFVPGGVPAEAQKSAGDPHPLPVGGAADVPGGVVRLDTAAVPTEFARDASIAWFDADALALPLAVRPWRAGDRMRPFGMPRGSRLVSDLLTTARVPPDRRADVPVVVDATGAVVAVVGVRAANAAVVGPETRRAVVLRFVPTQLRDRRSAGTA